MTGPAGARPARSDELAQGLLLVRATTLKMIRLQLAMERRDRREALEAVDDLVLLDRRIGSLLHDLPIASAPLAADRAEVEAEGQALARERFSLAAGVAGPVLAPRPPWSEPLRGEAEFAVATEAEAPTAGDGPDQPQGLSSQLAGGLVLLVLMAVASMVAWLVSGGGSWLTGAS
jgi:hypothetical protein